MNRKLTLADYPLAERRADLVRSATGKPLEALTLEAVVSGDVTMVDLRITAQALKDQAQIAAASGRSTLAQNFERGAELVSVPQEKLLAVYDLLRPGRAKSKDELLRAAVMLRETYGATTMAAFVEEAADVYERRGLWR